MTAWHGTSEALTPEQVECLEEVWRLRMEGIRAAKQFRAAETEALYWQALRLHEATLGHEHPSIADSLGALIFEFGRHSRHAEAAPLIGRSLDLLRQKPGPKYRGILQTLDGLAAYHQDRERHEEAEQYYQQVLAAREELMGPYHPRTARTLEDYARLLRQLGREPEATAMEARAKAIRSRWGTIGTRRKEECDGTGDIGTGYQSTGRAEGGRASAA